MVKKLGNENGRKWEKITKKEIWKKINPSKMEVAPQGCLNVINQKTKYKIN